jgi:hypothetical protein
MAPAELAPADLDGSGRRGRSVVAGAALVGSCLALYVAVLALTGGRFTYPLDDPAIHLAVARRLAYDGTWGVVAGHYQAASSSPLWTLVLAPTQWVVRGAAGEQVPLVLDLAAAGWVVALLARDMGALRADDRATAGRAAEVAAVVVLVVVVLWLPGLVLVGMEHTLHMALVLAAALAVEARWVRACASDAGSRWAARAPYVLVGLAAATRGESGFVAVALAVGLVAVGVGGWHDPRHPLAPLRARVAAGVGLGAAAGAALGVFGVVNLAYGQEILPNSVILKSLGDRGDTRRSPAAFAERLLADRVLVALVVVAIVVLVAARRRHRSPAGPADLVPAVFPAVVVLVAVALQAELGAVDGAFRYQAYLYGLGAWLVLRSLPAAHRALVGRWPGAAAVPAAALVLLLVPVAVPQVRAALDTPRGAEITWEQRYQVARFLAGSYRDDPIAIGELGYIALYHDGPLTDVYGLGDHEVLTATMQHRKDAGFFADLQRERGFRVVVTYTFTMSDLTPPGWYPVADWRSPRAYFQTTRFWAADPAEVAPLLAHLRAYEPTLPDDVRVHYNELAPLAAAEALDGG